MFENTPPNLPVETIQPLPEVLPSAPDAMPQAEPVTAAGSGGKEPEDIFSGTEPSATRPLVQAAPMQFAPAPRRSPLILVGIILGGVLVLGGLGAAAWFFLLSKPAAPASNVVVTQPTTTPPVEQVEQPPVIEQQPPVTAPPAGVNIPPPTIAEPGSGVATETAATQGSETVPSGTEANVATPPALSPVVDSDGDGLTDEEEALLGTNPNAADSDGDGFSDLAELKGGYSPTEKGAKITASPWIHVAQWNGLSWLLPTAWTWTVDPVDPNHVTVSAPPEGNISFLVQEGDIANAVAGAGSTGYVTKSGISGLKSADGLTYAFPVNGKTLIVKIEMTNPAQLPNIIDFVAGSIQAR